MSATPESGSPVQYHRLGLLGAALLFSTGGAAIKAITLNGWQIACFRSAVAAAAVLLLIPASRRKWNWKILIAGGFYAATLILFVLSNKLTTAANSIFLQSTAPFYLLVLGPWLLKERFHRSDLLLMLPLAAGMSLFFLGEQKALQTAPDPFTGNLLALLSGVAWAFTLGSLRWMASRPGTGDHSMAAVAAGNLLASLVCLPKALPATWNAADVWIIAYLGVFQIGLAYLLLTWGVRRVSALESSLLLLAEPALNPVWAALVHAEFPPALSISGGAIILGVSAARALGSRSAEPPRRSGT